ncbi:MAG: DUF2147 domain-containing protein [Sphingomicrobium sp.]
MLLMLLAIAEPDIAGLTGRWKHPSASVIVTITPCGVAYCGTVDWASEQAKADARRGGTDALVGTQLMTDFKPAGRKWKGRLFIPDLNRHGKAQLELVGTDRLKVTGCAVGRMICKSQLWTRAD